MSTPKVAFRVDEHVDTNGHDAFAWCSGPDELDNCPKVRKGDVVPCAGRVIKPAGANGSDTWRIAVAKESSACPIPSVQPRRWSFRVLGVLTLALGFVAGAGAATGWTLAAVGGKAAAPSHAAAAAPAAVPHFYLNIDTPGMLANNPQGPAIVPSSFTWPANTLIEVSIVGFDDATALPAQYAIASGIQGPMSISPLDAGNPNTAARSHTAISLDPVTGVAHTFTAPGLYLNVPVAPHAITTFTFRTGAPGHYAWHCMDPCGCGPNGWGCAMAMPGYMSGTITLA